ncbi:DUF881 domain-containing protein [Kineococcus sp. SYSU DK006]|uniref:DUF881 domain-containing protein n=1 Tax=Kineococcus sp. SYSU DK006 TaxID=3383127 RepID=UPI003D7DB96A
MSGARAPRDPAASTALLTEVMQRPLDPGYAAAAARRAERGEQRRPAARAGTLLAALAIGVLLAVAGLRAAAAEPEADRGRRQLLERVEAGTARTDALAAQVAALQAANADLAARLGGSAAAAASARADELAVAAAAVAVSGPGVRVVLDDAPVPDEGIGTGAADTSGRVLDRDVQLVVNGLWQAGAEAVSVNGQRLSALSSIRAAGEAVLVDHRPLTPPYAVSAVGDPTRLQTGLAASVAGRYLQVLRDNYGIGVEVQARTEDDPLTLPAAQRLDLRLTVADAR